MDIEKAKSERVITYAIAGVVCFVFLSLTTCSIHMNSFTPEEERANVAIANVEGKVAQERAEQKHKENMERLTIVSKLIKDQKLDPMAARCAVEGWTEKTSNVCLELVKNKKPTGIVENLLVE